MRRPIIPHDTLVFVGDGRKALFIRNAGDEKFAHFVIEQTFVDDNPPTHDQGTDRPGRGFASAASVRRSAMEPTDWHDIEEHRFAERVAKALERLTRERKRRRWRSPPRRGRWRTCAPRSPPTSRRKSFSRSTRTSPGCRYGTSRSMSWAGL